MLGVVLGLIIVVATVASSEITSWSESLGDATESAITTKNSQSHRQGKFFPIFSVVRFANSECSGSNSFNGTCFTKRECASYGGSGYGTCANGIGVCCVFRKACATTVNLNNTYFVSPEYPRTYEGGERCTISIERCNTNICQLRIDFLDFSLAQPNASGSCDYDFMLVSGGSTRVPRICGENLNQHVYVDFNGAYPITISIDTNVDYKFNRRWNLRLQQIACDSACKAPTGCLQYFKSSSGTVMSFNYGRVPNERISTPLGVTGTRQMLNLDYGVCVRMALGYCSIEWSQTDTLSFTVSNDSSTVDSSIPIEDTALSGASCDRNYVLIPNPSVNSMRLMTDRFCGNGFVTKTSSSKPFVMYVMTTETPSEIMDMMSVENRGFSLKYRQIACPV